MQEPRPVPRPDDRDVMKLRAELSKVGVDAFNCTNVQDSIKEVRRGVNKLEDRAAKLYVDGQAQEANELASVVDVAGQCIARWQYEADMKEFEAAWNRGEIDPINGTTLGKGSDVSLIQANESFSKGVSRAQPARAHGIGDLLAGMVGVNQSQDIRAALSEGIDSAGGLSVPSYLLDQVIDAMRARMVTMRAGAQTVRLDTDKTNMLRITSDPKASWHGENELITESQPSFDAVTFEPKTLVTMVKLSRELLEDSLNINTAIELAIAGALGEAMDKAMLFGSGQNNEPLGLANHTGLATVDVGGPITSYAKPLEGVLKLYQNNVWEDTRLHMLTNPLAWSQMQGLTSSEGQPLMPPSSVAAVPQLVSTAIPSDTIIMGDFNKLLVGIRSQMRIELLRETFADRYQVAFLASMRVDCGVMHESCFVKLENISAPSTATKK
ncbi:MAG TPA: phage major capsid protein [Orrella sp.]